MKIGTRVAMLTITALMASQAGATPSVSCDASPPGCWDCSGSFHFWNAGFVNQWTPS